MRQYKNSSTMNSRRAIFVSPNHHTHHHFSSFAKRTARCDWYRTIEKLMPLRSETNILFLLLWISFMISALRTYTQSSTSNGGTTTYAFAKGTRRKRHSRLDTAFLSLQSCTLDLPIH